MSTTQDSQNQQRNIISEYGYVTEKGLIKSYSKIDYEKLLGSIDIHSIQERRKDVEPSNLINKNDEKIIHMQISSMRKLFVQLKYYFKEFCDEHKLSDDHGYSHAMSVVDNAEMAMNSSIDLYNDPCYKYYYHILIAAMLHDIDDRKLFPNNHNNENALMLLDKVNRSESIKEVVLKMINLVSASTNGNSNNEKDKWLYIPRDADRIEAIGIIGIQRVIQFSESHDHNILLESTKLATNQIELKLINVDERYKNYIKNNGGSVSMLDHIYDKLLSISTMSSGNEYLMITAQERQKIMEKFVFELCLYIKHIDKFQNKSPLSVSYTDLYYILNYKIME